MKVLAFEDIPKWYGLWWDRDEESLFLKIHRKFIETAPYRETAKHFKLFGVERDLFLRCETRLGQDTFGFDEVIVREETDADWITYRIRIPHVIHQTGMVCPECQGTRNRISCGEIMGDCMDCRGTGWQRVRDWDKARLLCISLSVLFSAIEFSPEVDIQSEEKQWFTLLLGGQAGRHFLGGQMSPDFVDLLRSVSRGSDVELPIVVEAEKSAYRQMFGEVEDFHQHSFHSWVTGGNLIIDCPGDACGIHPSPHVHDIRRGYGVEFTCHNVDGWYQELILLCGLAAAASMFMNRK